MKYQRQYVFDFSEETLLEKTSLLNKDAYKLIVDIVQTVLKNCEFVNEKIVKTVEYETGESSDSESDSDIESLNMKYRIMNF